MKKKMNMKKCYSLVKWEQIDKIMDITNAHKSITEEIQKYEKFKSCE